MNVSFHICQLTGLYENILAIFGINRRCPTELLAESFWEVRECVQDKDCDFPRICCPNGSKRYCTNWQPDELPVGRQIVYPVESISQFFQCTAPPPPAFDKHPKPCNSRYDLFNNFLKEIQFSTVQFQPFMFSQHLLSREREETLPTTKKEHPVCCCKLYTDFGPDNKNFH